MGKRKRKKNRKGSGASGLKQKLEQQLEKNIEQANRLDDQVSPANSYSTAEETEEASAAPADSTAEAGSSTETEQKTETPISPPEPDKPAQAENESPEPIQVKDDRAPLTQTSEKASEPRHEGEVPVLEFRNVTYENPNHFLHDFSFKLYAGKNVVFFGPEGCGKDLLLPLGTGLITPDSGQVLFKGQDLKNLENDALYEIRKEYGYLLKNFGLINNLSLFDNILLPMRYHHRKTDPAEIEKLLLTYDVDSIRNERPNMLTESQKLKASFLRALLLQPALIFFDSIETAQDPLKLSEFMRLASEYLKSHDIAYLVSTYNVTAFNEYMNTFCMIQFGRIVLQAEGNIFDYTDSNPFLKQYLEHSHNTRLTARN